MIKKYLIVKFGSSCLVNDVGLDQARIDQYAKKLSKLYDKYNLVLVSSGSVAVGKRFLSEMGRDVKNFDSATIASLGSAGAAGAWQVAFKKQDILAGQILVTHREIDDNKEGLALDEAIKNNAQSSVVSVVNENDVLSQKELKKITYGGDNDGLAAHLAIRLKADALLLLTDVEGFMQNNKVRRKIQVSEISFLQENLIVSGGDGTGSMHSKLDAAMSAAIEDIKTFIVDAGTLDYKKILDGETGTEVVK